MSNFGNKRGIRQKILTKEIRINLTPEQGEKLKEIASYNNTTASGYIRSFIDGMYAYMVAEREREQEDSKE